MLKRIHRRRDVHPSEGRAKYGDATFAGPVNKKYPIDTPGWIKAACREVHSRRAWRAMRPRKESRCENGTETLSCETETQLC
jgi:uncharacterized protein DUF6582